MKTLIIHPEDPSTIFLNGIYNTLENKTIITGGVSKNQVKEMIKEHDRVMMMGHGGPMGLFSVGKFHGTNGLIIDKEMVDVLSEKDNNVFIWCNADQFVNYHNLKGFFSGMFISEVGEALYCGIPREKATQSQVTSSNYTFSSIMSKYSHKHVNEIFENVKTEYNDLAKENLIAKYNHERLYLTT